MISPDEINKIRRITIVPMTTKSHSYPTRVNVKYNNQTGWAIIDQIRTIDKSRILKNMGHLQHSEIIKCKQVIKETFVD